MFIFLNKIANPNLKPSYWTSGFDLSGSEEFQWCSMEGNVSIDDEMWKQGFPNTPTTEMGQCVKATFAGEIELENDNCTTLLPVICEVLFCFVYCTILKFQTRQLTSASELLREFTWKRVKKRTASARVI